MSDPTLFEDDILVEDEADASLGDTCATCAHFTRTIDPDSGVEDGWGKCELVNQPEALFEIEGGGVLWVEQGYYCNQYEADGEQDELVEVPFE